MRVPATEGRAAVKKTVRKVLIVILLLVFLGSLGMLLRQQQTYREGEDIYAQAEQLVQLPAVEKKPEPSVPVGTPAESETPAETPEPEPTYVDPYADALNNMDFAALRAT